ncbi:hypothetical protein CE195_11175 [Sodalis-like symbiont of Philaenus spumarius]|nr:hypothetical protein CE195_11175 [Sodalis-like symbiont of Philaenus spumarius]
MSNVLDATYKVAITGFDRRIRVGGMAEITGFNTDLPAKRRLTLETVVRDLFPVGKHIDQATFWTGLAGDDAGRYAAGGRYGTVESLSEYRPRYPWLDNGGWFGASFSGYYQRSGPGNLL